MRFNTSGHLDKLLRLKYSGERMLMCQHSYIVLKEENPTARKFDGK